MKPKQPKLTFYTVEGYSGWFVVLARNIRLARHEGVVEFGRGGVKSVTVATESDVKYYSTVKGEIETIE